ncbi:MAG: divergent PAP2 family protein [Clostridiales bacterium]|nr:divergent PAP2 family protein [Clostridiales bacterium]MDY3764826.1 divergent PAP2 family protein [Candidatus Ventricola sp.]MCI6587439.1 divergent PAP2 family protein [Clostridiales bacterium]MCI7704025.1 divergent PAP2 family protein [Clostridiales bacterium]MDY3832926.1 divergent PAP2 family protein [Candidatus Ventricola sp.]
MGVILEILGNRVIQAAALAWAVAQALKVMLTLAISRRFDKSRVLGSGGMPSSHSAMACAMLMTIGFREGFSSSIFALAFCFSGVVMYDAAGVRRSTGKNAAVINQLMDMLSGNGYTFDEKRLKELVGHTPIQVLAGALLGTLIGTLMA